MINIKEGNMRDARYRLKQKGQTLLEFAVLFIVLVGALFAMQKYIKRGVQGKWKESIDGMGKQYDPSGNMETTWTLYSNSETNVDIIPEPQGYRTWRTDISNISENKTEHIILDDL